MSRRPHRIHIELDLTEPAAGLQTALKWDPELVDILKIAPGPDLAPGEINAFFKNLDAGEATIGLVRNPGSTTGKRAPERVVDITVRVPKEFGERGYAQLHLAETRHDLTGHFTPNALH